MPHEGIETLFGSFDENLRVLESALGVRLKTSGHQVVVDGPAEAVAVAERVLEQLGELLRGGYRFAKDDVKVAAQLIAQDPSVGLGDYFVKGGPRAVGRQRVLPKSVTQKRYLDAIDTADIVFGVGPAGTGKTYLAMAQAVSCLLSKRVTRIILARPAVERSRGAAGPARGRCRRGSGRRAGRARRRSPERTRCRSAPGPGRSVDPRSVGSRGSRGASHQ